MEINYKQIGGILLALIITISGTIYLEKTGDYHNCRAEWIENENGTYTCPKDNVTHYCYEMEYRGSGWYRCWIGKPVVIEKDKIGKGKWVCNPNSCVKEGN